VRVVARHASWALRGARWATRFASTTSPSSSSKIDTAFLRSTGGLPGTPRLAALPSRATPLEGAEVDRQGQPGGGQPPALGATSTSRSGLSVPRSSSRSGRDAAACSATHVSRPDERSRSSGRRGPSRTRGSHGSHDQSAGDPLAAEFPKPSPTTVMLLHVRTRLRALDRLGRHGYTPGLGALTFSRQRSVRGRRCSGVEAPGATARLGLHGVMRTIRVACADDPPIDGRALDWLPENSPPIGAPCMSPAGRGPAAWRCVFRAHGTSRKRLGDGRPRGGCSRRLKLDSLRSFD
jgi:hypothetical protein